MKSFLKTIICLTTSILLAIIIFLLVSKINQITNNKGTKIPNNNQIITMLEEKINNNDELRLSNVSYETLSNETLIKYALYSLDKDDYIEKEYKIKDGLCTIDNVMFNVMSSCKVRTIKTSTLNNKIKSLFNKEPNIEYIELEYKNYYCKYDNENYYCLLNNYQDYNYSYVVIKEAYENKDNIDIYEYYLNINVSNENDCQKYFNKEYCSNYKEEDKPSLDNKIIEENGTLYKHTFIKEDNIYYLKESIVTNN